MTLALTYEAFDWVVIRSVDRPRMLELRVGDERRQAQDINQQLAQN